MYFLIGWPKCLKQINESCSIIRHLSSCDRMFFAVLTNASVTLWYSKPCIQIVCYCASRDFLTKVGEFCHVEWKTDSTMLAIMTVGKSIVFLRKELDRSIRNHHCLYVQRERLTSNHRHVINGAVNSNSVPAYKLTVISHVTLNSTISCLLSVRDELVVATHDGNLNRLCWGGSYRRKATLHLSDICISSDLQQLKGAKLSDYGVITQMEYSPTLAGYAMVLSTGHAVFVIPSSSSDGKSTHGVWVRDLTTVTCVAVNHRYRLLAFGVESGEGLVYMMDEEVGCLELSHKLSVSSRDFPDAGSVTGGVWCMKWTPDSTAVAVAWKNGGFSLWSVFGALLLCTLGDDYKSHGNRSLYPPSIVSMEWGLEGYNLWAVTHLSPLHHRHHLLGHCSRSGGCVDGGPSGGRHKGNSSGFCERREDCGGERSSGEQPLCELLQFQFVKSALTVNPCLSNHEHILLQGEDRLYMSTVDTIWRGNDRQYLSSQNSDMTNVNSTHPYVGSKQWLIIPVSHSYLTANWPIRYSAIDRSGQCLVVAGRTGLAHYSMFTRKWKLFGNENQERDMVVSGGLLWWKGFIVLACFNMLSQSDEIRCYPRSCKLDNTFADTHTLPASVLLLNIFCDSLVVFCADSHVVIFNLHRKELQARNPSAVISHLQKVYLAPFISHPLCVVGIFLISSTSVDCCSRGQCLSKDAESLLLNISGKLMIFHRDHSGPQIMQNSDHHKNRIHQLPFCSPSVVATSVENVWMTMKANSGKLQLMDALWLSCGIHGMKVWLPLLSRSEDKAHNFMSRRIMLPFRVDIYPLAVLFEDAVILGVASDTLTDKARPHGESCATERPYCSIERMSQIYLHHILRQLLRRNLGINALELARSCNDLTYFPHVLELLLHEVLEAEATSKDPIPDPLLPRVVAFIQEFPEYLQTVVHCARKTEIALWPYLFSAVGNPKDLFEESLMNNSLTTSAKYLIILQNMEKPIVSRQHTTLLLDCALTNQHWDLCRDIVRFLKCGNVDASFTSSCQRLPTTFSSSHPLFYHVYDNHAQHTNSKVSSMRRMCSSVPGGGGVASDTGTGGGGGGRELAGSHGSTKQLMVSDSIVSASKRLTVRSVKTSSKHGVMLTTSTGQPSADEMYVDTMLCRHACRLLSSNQLAALGSFAANMADFNLVSFLKQEKTRSAKVDDFVTALQDIHRQFDWPYPIVSLSVAVSSQYAGNADVSGNSVQYDSLLDMDAGLLHPSENMLSSDDVSMKSSVHKTDVTLSTVRADIPGLLHVPDLAASCDDNVYLDPESNHKHDGCSATAESFDSSSLISDNELNGGDASHDLVHNLEAIVHEVANTGSLGSQSKLRYLLEIMLEADCLEWATVLAVVLRDLLTVVRIVNMASITDSPLDVVGRMREGLSFLELWADTECVGYSPFFRGIKSQMTVLSMLVEQPRKSVSSESASSVVDVPCVENGNMSPSVQSIHTDTVAFHSNIDQSRRDRFIDCLVS